MSFDQEKVKTLIEDTMTEFATEYTLGYTRAVVFKIREEAEATPPMTLQLVKVPEAEGARKQGWVNKRGANKKWAKRWCVVDKDFDVYFYKSEKDVELKDKSGKSKKQGKRMTCFGYRVKRMDDEKEKNKDLGFKVQPLNPDDVTKRSHYFHFGTAEEYESWKKMLGECCDLAPSPMHKDPVRRMAFEFCFTKMIKSNTFVATGSETDMLASLVFKKCEESTLQDTYAAIPMLMKTMLVDRIRGVVGGLIETAVDVAWKGACASIDQLEKPIEDAIRKVVAPLFAGAQRIKDAIELKMAHMIAPLITKFITPVATTVLKNISTPMLRAQSDTLSEFCTGVVRGSTFLSDALQKRENEFELVILAARIISDNAELELFGGKLTTSCVKLLKLAQANYLNVDNKNFEVTSAKLFHDFLVEQRLLLSWFVDTIVLKSFSDAFIPLLDEICGPLDALVPEPVKDFLSPSDVVKEVVFKAFGSAVKLLFETGELASYPSKLAACFQQNGVQVDVAKSGLGESKSSRGPDVWETCCPLRVREGPSPSAKEVYVIAPNQKINCLEIQGNWMKHDAGWSMMQGGNAGAPKVFLVRVSSAVSVTPPGPWTPAQTPGMTNSSSWSGTMPASVSMALSAGSPSPRVSVSPVPGSSSSSAAAPSWFATMPAAAAPAWSPPVTPVAAAQPTSWAMPASATPSERSPPGPPAMSSTGFSASSRTLPVAVSAGAWSPPVTTLAGSTATSWSPPASSSGSTATSWSRPASSSVALSSNTPSPRSSSASPPDESKGSPLVVDTQDHESVSWATSPESADLLAASAESSGPDIVMLGNRSALTTECPICLQSFQTQGVLAPRVLSTCGHVFCFRDLFRLSKSGALKCPSCETITPFPKLGVESLPLATGLLGYLQATAAVKSAQGDAEAPACKSCEADPVSLHCAECRDTFCALCAKARHRGPKANHKLNPWTSAIKIVSTQCAIHTKYDRDLVCRHLACDSALICSMCRDYGDHKGHTVDLISNITDGARGELASALSNNTAFTDRASIACAGVSDVIMAIKSKNSVEPGSAQIAKQQIRARIAEVKKMLEMREQALCSAVDLLEAAKLRQLESQSSELAALLSVSYAARVQAETLLATKDNYAFFEEVGSTIKALAGVPAIGGMAPCTSSRVEVAFDLQPLTQEVRGFGSVEGS